MKNLHVIDPPSGAPGVSFSVVNLTPHGDLKQTLRIIPHRNAPKNLSLVLAKDPRLSEINLSGLVSKPPSRTLIKALRKKYGEEELSGFDLTQTYSVSAKTRAAVLEARFRGGTRAIIAMAGGIKPNRGAAFSIVQLAENRIVGGSTFAFRSD